ncbi:Fe-S cluster assembly protein NifU [Caldichromatium japonicum]|uniref:Nitrogen fixation protein NifU n=1 Tax=Caldichromatium japonicum TaxID=2699430 RepID=A0A6G7VFA7_9GAMM|nr:Fe-S cluster assembly protein NifU [Caldichromatium japonicum]QIK38580.1 Fe-S cluster assembly protein NifU [Caldichromatium japonicum]
MWDYSEKVREHFFNPRNVGALEDANGIGEVGSIQCGDALRLMIKVDPATETILDARFQTFGCGSAIASSSALTEIIKGMTLDEALKVSNQDIADYLDGLPPEKMHCSVMGREALQAAVANYRGEDWREDHEEGALVCKCFAVDAKLIEETIRANGLTSVEQVTHYTKAGGGCTACHEGIEEILVKVAKETCTAPTADKKPTPPAIPPAPTLTSFQRMRKIEETIASIRPMLQRDHGDIEIVEIDGKNIYVNLKGACAGCMMEAATLNGIQTRLVEALGEFVRLLPASQLKRAA